MKFKLSSDFECGMVAGYRLAGTVDLLGISYTIIFRIYREGIFFFKSENVQWASILWVKMHNLSLCFCWYIRIIGSGVSTHESMDLYCLESMVQAVAAGDVMVWGMFFSHTLGPVVSNELNWSIKDQSLSGL